VTKTILSWLFGAHAQVVIGAITFMMGVAFWIYIEVVYHTQLQQQPLVGAIFRVSMFFGLVACYAIIATGLGFRATERVETAVVNNIEQADEIKVKVKDE
jgi:hypothetical protein